MRTPEAKAQTARLKASGPFASEADMRHIPELTDEELAQCYRIRKQQITARIDADILLWLKRKPRRYQTNLNAILREAKSREEASIRKG